MSHRPRPRLESLSDLIYGLSLSIGAISLVITGSQSSNVGDINRNILAFLFVFLILITSWIIYTGDMSVLPQETRLVTFLNVVLLVLVVVIPYLFDQSRNTLILLSVVVLLSLAAPWEWVVFQVHVRMLIWYVPIAMFWFNHMRTRPYGVAGAHTASS